MTVRNSLLALSVGDGFGEQRFSMLVDAGWARQLPPAPWRWTDDTHMALSIIEILETHGEIRQDELALAFARRWAEEPWRGYARGAARLLESIHGGASWFREAPMLFPGGGSWGNGGAMRAAPIGAAFPGDPQRAGDEGSKSAAVTHGHPEGRAGGRAVAAAASIAAAGGLGTGKALIAEVADLLGADAPKLRQALHDAYGIPAPQWETAYDTLGVGWRVSAVDTVPLCIWVAAHYSGDWEDTLWRTMAGGGDSDTTCAIVGGILGAGGVEPPAHWLEATEPLPPPYGSATDVAPNLDPQ